MASHNESERPHISEHGAWPSTSANSFRQQYLAPADGSSAPAHTSPEISGAIASPDVPTSTNDTLPIPNTDHLAAATNGTDVQSSSEPTAVPSPADSQHGAVPITANDSTRAPSEEELVDQEKTDVVGGFEPIKTITTHKSNRPGMQGGSSRMTEDDIFRALSRRRTNTSGRQGSFITEGEASEQEEEQAEIERLMSRMFGKNRKANSEEEKTRHVGLVFRNLTVKGMGLGAALQPTLSGPFLGLPRLIKALISGGPKAAGGKPPVRTILNDFTGCVRPGEMLLVLGRPGSGCSTFLKVLANQRFGYESIDGEVTYGGTDAKTMGKHYRGEVLYNPEDDLHYATLKVKDTLKFALTTRTPGKASRNEGESRSEYITEFLRVVSKLFWIEHTMNTKVGDEFVRGVSGGEKKRVSIAEAMITKASTQCWDNSTRGLDASTALEYVESLRSLTNMAHISTSVALYQAGESLYDLFDKVVLIDEGRCLYYGSSEGAAAYFEGLGFRRPQRWTTADFLTSVSDPHERQIREGYEHRIPRSAEQFEAAFKKSQLYETNIHDVETFEAEAEVQRQERLAASTKATKEKNYTLPFHKQVWACTHRQVLVTLGDKQSLGGKWGGILFQALIVGSLFFNMPKTSAGVFERGGVMFFMLLFNALLALAELTSAFSSRPILLKHKSLINPVQYGFEALMSNEFYNLNIQCVPPYLVPSSGPGVAPQYQSCLLSGSQPGQPNVNGADYIMTAFTYTRAHLWRNIGIIIGFWLFFVALTMIGMEIQKPNAGGGAVTIFKRGQAPKSVERAMEKGGVPEDEEKQMAISGDEKVLEDTTSSDSDKGVKGVASNTSIFTYSNVNYTIPYEKGERKLLNNCQGFVRPGKLTALMGASGAGKTTLLNTLAQRINFGVVTGDFLVDGRPLPRSFQRATGFAEQQDVHEPTATIREALRFSALLRQPKEVPIEEKYAYCETIIDLLEMREIAGATIGVIGEGLNQEQRKRVTIGVELASKPELLLFLDEPTSGLDSGAAFNIIRFLRKLADSGQALLVTIHQPSSVLFEYFDELILLKSGGRVVYHGELGKDSRQLIDYFERNGAHKCPPRANPAEYMLEAIGAGDPNYKGKDWGDTWAQSAEHEDRTQEIQSMINSRRSASTSGKTEDDREYAMPLSTQVYAVVYRSFTNYWRTPDYMVGKFMLHIFTGLFNTFTFYHIGNETIDFQSRLFSIFMTLTISPPLIQQLQPKYLAFRQIFMSRESRSKIYSWFAFTCGAVLVEIPYSLLAGTIYFMCWWWGAVGRGSSKFDNAYTWMMLMLFELFYVSFGQAIASFSPNELLASLLVPVFFLFVVSFCGVVVPFAALPHFWQSWMYYLTPFRYLLDGFLGAAVHGRPVVCSSTEFARFAPPPGQTCQSYTKSFIAMAGGYVQNGSGGLCEFCQYATGDEFAAGFNVYYSNKWLDYGVFWAFCVFNFIVVFVCSWLWLGGGKRIKDSLSPAARKQKKANQKAASEKV
ncbi:ATP-binding cassette, subfamily G (WHITE), member 2, PDR, partial [Lecanoromycetidae sp. Uapishka_2]